MISRSLCLYVDRLGTVLADGWTRGTVLVSQLTYYDESQ